MKYTPIDEKEYKMRNVWPAGVYPCEIANCEEGASKKTNDPYFKCVVKIFNKNDKYRLVTTYLMAEGNAKWQLRSAAEVFGFLEEYKAGTLLAENFSGKTAYAKVYIEEDENGVYDSKNIIREFTNKAPKEEPEVTSDVADDEVPF